MANKTLIPALKAHVGDWNYYVCIMKYAEVARQIQFAHELQGSRDLHTLLQRGLSARTGEIVDYLKKSKHRFLGALIVAAYGGDPHYMPVKMEDPDGMLQDLDDQFGVLTFDGTQSYFALDGQHRLRAIKDALKTADEELRAELNNEDIAVIMVSHMDTEDGRARTRRLFTNINRNAKTTSKAENIALDEDDPFAIITRRMLSSHKLFSTDGRVIVFTNINEEGEMTLASGQVPKSHKSAVTTIGVLYEMVKEMHCFIRDIDDFRVDRRPSAESLDEAYDKVTHSLDQIMTACGDISEVANKSDNLRDIRAPKEDEGRGHAMLRPIVQRAVCRAVRIGIEQNRATHKTILARLSKLNWTLGEAPWTAVALCEAGKVHMQTGRDNVELLDQLLVAHLYPSSKEEIRRALSSYKSLRATPYPHSVEDLSVNLSDT